MTGQSVRISSSSSFEGFYKQKKSDPPMTSGETPSARSEGAQHASKPKKADGAFKTISEVADELDVQQHVLRFWETKFTQVKPLKRGGGRRYYRPEDVALLKHIHHLLYTEGYTIKGVQKLLKGQGKQQIVARAEADNENESSLRAQPKVKPAEPQQQPAQTQNARSIDPAQREVLEVMLEELKALRGMINA